jgi:hypothetical protein
MIKMLGNMFEITLGYLRSRVKRIILFINKLTEIEEKNGYEDADRVFDLEKVYKEFKKISSNYLEPEYLPSSDNGFIKIIDQNLNGTEAYSNLISSNCI